VQQLNSTLRHRIFVLSTFEAMEQWLWVCGKLSQLWRLL
jgi:hypothetical protein